MGMSGHSLAGLWLISHQIDVTLRYPPKENSKWQSLLPVVTFPYSMIAITVLFFSSLSVTHRNQSIHAFKELHSNSLVHWNEIFWVFHHCRTIAIHIHCSDLPSTFLINTWLLHTSDGQLVSCNFYYSLIFLIFYLLIFIDFLIFCVYDCTELHCSNLSSRP